MNNCVIAYLYWALFEILCLEKPIRPNSNNIREMMDNKICVVFKIKSIQFTLMYHLYNI